MPSEPLYDAEDSQPVLSRRAVLRAGAWAAPVIAVAVASPAYAASASGYNVSLFPAGADVWSDGSSQIQGTRLLRMWSNNDLVPVPAGYLISLSWEAASLVHLTLSPDDPSWPCTLSGDQGDLTLTLQSPVDSNSVADFFLVPSVPPGTAPGVYSVDVTVIGSADADGDRITQLSYTVQVF